MINGYINKSDKNKKVKWARILKVRAFPLSGGDWDGAWKAGAAGLASGAWTVTDGFGMVKAWGAKNAFTQLGGKLG